MEDKNPEKYADFIRLCVLNDIDIVVNRADYLICLWGRTSLKALEPRRNNLGIQRE
ncbi:MAG: hypothetical protein Ct9H90mP7_2090 [Candidatus Neomarinimicrobiota bacterium]|nr:MAG: hypothetical protein Ct9H90mP7_2090 [Candidatus Neomarinimicrobiota bacterium]